MSEPRAAVWDVDGTMIDSLELHFASWREALGRERFVLTRERFLQTFGRRNEEILPELLGPEVSAADVARIGAAKEADYRSLVRARGVALLEGVAEWIERLDGSGWRQAVASSGPRANVETVLEVTGVGRYFTAVVGAEDVRHGKPAPDGFLLAATRLGVMPSRCVILEDAPAGIEAGRRAGMSTVGVLTSHSTLDGDLVVRRLDELADDALERLLDAAAGSTAMDQSRFVK